MNRAAERYVKLVLAVGRHDRDYVDAYYGPPDWKTEAQTGKRPLPEIRTEASSLLAEIARIPAAGEDEMAALRRQYPVKQLESLAARVDILSGKKMSFDAPQSLIAERSANFGIEVAFPPKERGEFERKVLFPLAGIDTSLVERFEEMQKLTQRLSYAVNEAARRYLNGQIDRAAAVAWLVEYAVMPPARAEKQVRFIEQYRSYVINYNLGKDLVRRYVESKGGTGDNSDARWREFALLLSSPRLPSGLAVK